MFPKIGTNFLITWYRFGNYRQRTCVKSHATAFFKAGSNFRSRNIGWERIVKSQVLLEMVCESDKHDLTRIDIQKTNVPTIRLSYRYQTLMEERYMVLGSLRKLDEESTDDVLVDHVPSVIAEETTDAFLQSRDSKTPLQASKRTSLSSEKRGSGSKSADANAEKSDLPQEMLEELSLEERADAVRELDDIRSSLRNSEHGAQLSDTPMVPLSRQSASLGSEESGDLGLQRARKSSRTPGVMTGSRSQSLVAAEPLLAGSLEHNVTMSPRRFTGILADDVNAPFLALNPPVLPVIENEQGTGYFLALGVNRGQQERQQREGMELDEETDPW